MTTDQFLKDLSGIDIRSPIQSYKSEPQKNCVLTGRITGNLPENVHIAVLAYSLQSSKSTNKQTTQLASYTIIQKPGSYTLFVAPGKYHLFAFVDRNKNNSLEDDEYVGRYGRPSTVHVTDSQVVGGLDIDASGILHPFAEIPISVKLMHHYIEPDDTLEHGRVVTLNESKFAKDFGEMGLWSSDEFIQKNGVNIYALAPYNPGRIPVLFVHGAGGTPLDFDYMVKYVDRKRFQPWFFFYPAGLRLQTLADLLHARLKVLHKKYGFKQLYITAHSMGGLVARAYINRYSSDSTQNYLQAYISLSTPYAGNDSARLGVRYSPARVPSWQDVATDSDFIDTVYAQRLPHPVRFYLLFGFGGNQRDYKELSDGVITLKSQLASRAKAEATGIQGFDEDHVTILKSQEVAKYYRQILDRESSGRKAAVLSKVAVGRLYIDTVPENAKVQILNISFEYKRGMALQPGNYLLEVSAYGYKSWSGWVDLADGENIRLKVRMAKMDPKQLADLPPIAAEYVRMLKSENARQKRAAARAIYRENFTYPVLYDTAEQELRKGYRTNLNDRYHVDAMAWMCQLLGASRQAHYRSTLEMVALETGNVEMVALETGNVKLQRYAERNMHRLK
jgi:uncharacterized alpha/beta hydrolase family protein